MKQVNKYKKIFCFLLIFLLLGNNSIIFASGPINGKGFQVEQFNMVITNDKGKNLTKKINLCSPVLNESGDIHILNTIKGKITDNFGKVLNNGTVQIFNPKDELVGKYYTNESGIYTTENLNPGDYKFKFSCDNSSCLPKDGFFENPVWYNGGKLLSVKKGVIYNSINGILDKVLYSTIKGKISLSNGNPASGVEVNYGNLTTTTDNEGNYFLYSKEGDGVLKFFYNNKNSIYYSNNYYVHDADSKFEISLNLKRSEIKTNNYVFPIKQKPEIFGVVTDQNQQPISNVEVKYAGYKTKTDTNGKYSLSIFPSKGTLDFEYIPGRSDSNQYILESQKLSFDNGIPFEIGQNTIAMNRNMIFYRTLKQELQSTEMSAKIIGQVKDNLGNTLSKVKVRYLNYSAITDEFGYYTLDRLPTGTGVLSFDYEGNIDSEHYIIEKVKDYRENSSNIIKLESQKLYTMNMIFNKETYISITGKATDSLGYPLNKVTINYESADSNNKVGQSKTEVKTNIKGIYSLKAMKGLGELVFTYDNEKISYSIDTGLYEIVEKEGANGDIDVKINKSNNKNEITSKLDSKIPEYFVVDEILKKQINYNQNTINENIVFEKQKYNIITGKIQDQYLKNLPGVKVSIDNQPIQYSDTNGDFMIWSRPGNDKKIVFDYTNYISDDFYIENPIIEKSINVIQGTDIDNINQTIVKKRYSIISGKTSTNLNRYLSGVKVVIYKKGLQKFDIKPFMIANTDENGKYIFSKLKSGTYLLQFTNNTNDTVETKVTYIQKKSFEIKVDEMKRWDFDGNFTDINCTYHTPEIFLKEQKRIMPLYNISEPIPIKLNAPKEQNIILGDLSNDLDTTEIYTNWTISSSKYANGLNYNSGYKSTYIGDADNYYYEPSKNHGLLAGGDESNFYSLMDYININKTSNQYGLINFSAKKYNLNSDKLSYFNYFHGNFILDEKTNKDNICLNIINITGGNEVILNGKLISFAKIGNKNFNDKDYKYKNYICLNKDINGNSGILKTGENNLVLIQSSRGGQEKLKASLIINK